MSSLAKARAHAKSKSDKTPGKGIAIKKTPKSKNVGTATKAKKAAATPKPDSTTDSESEDDSKDSEAGDLPRGRLFFEGDPGFEDAYQAARAARRQAAPSPQFRPSRRAPVEESDDQPHSLSPNTPSASESLGALGGQGPAPLAAHPRSNTTTTPSASTPLADPPPPPHRTVISAITGLPLVGPNRRPEALSGYGDGPTVRRVPNVGSTRAAPSASTRATQGNTARNTGTRVGDFAFPVAPANRGRPDVYVRAPDGLHHHFTDNSGRPTYLTRATPDGPVTLIRGMGPAQASAYAHTNMQSPTTPSVSLPLSTLSYPPLLPLPLPRPRKKIDPADPH